MSLDLDLLGPACPTCHRTDTFWSGNITHNLGDMAKAAGVYGVVWRPEENGITTAAQMIPLLRAGLAKLKRSPARFRALNPANGWGSYDVLRTFLADYLAECARTPTATVRARR
jgi:hypothetical protein